MRAREYRIIRMMQYCLCVIDTKDYCHDDVDDDDDDDDCTSLVISLSVGKSRFASSIFSFMSMICMSSSGSTSF